jgi:hypothetical protein
MGIPMFEVGKKYKRPKCGPEVYECLSIYRDGVVGWLVIISDTHSAPSPASYYHNEFWEEYVEPRKEYFNAHRDAFKGTSYSGPYASEEQANWQKVGKRYGILILTHHSDVKVETEFRLVRELK